MKLTNNDMTVLEYISRTTGRFSKLDIETFEKEHGPKDIQILRNLFYICSDYDYDWTNGYIEIQLNQITQIILF